MRSMRVWTLGLVVCGGLLGACHEDEDGPELGTYLLTPENRDFQFELREDGTFEAYGLEWDLQLSSWGVWSQDDGETVLRPEDDDPSKDSVSDEHCPTRCLRWSTTEGFTNVTEVRLEPTLEPGVLQARLYDRVEEKDVLQTFTLADPGTTLPGP